MQTTFSRAHARTLTTCGTTLALGALAVALAGSASAHVTVNSTDARQDGYGKVTVRVPNESETAGTTQVSVSMPAGVTISSVRVKPHVGWTATAPKVTLAKPVVQGDKTVTEAVSVITWKADKGVSIKPGTFDEFEFSAGRLPASVTTLSFPAIQTYSDGKVVKWDQPAVKGAAEPEHPSPVLNLLPSEDAEKAAAAALTAPKASSNDSLARGAAAGAGIVALGGIGLGLRRKRSDA
jgi:uncharacterized protein YcnI